MGFGDLQSQKVAEYWQDGPEEFVPWLASALRGNETSELERLLGMDLDVLDTEDVGAYDVGILAQETETGRRLIVEDGVTAERELGRSIASAADLDADAIVWIAPEFTEAHLDAVRWLAERSPSDVDLCSIQLEIWKIGDSEPAVRLKRIDLDSQTVAQYEGAPIRQRSMTGRMTRRLRAFNRWLRRSRDENRL